LFPKGAPKRTGRGAVYRAVEEDGKGKMISPFEPEDGSIGPGFLQRKKEGTIIQEE